MVRGTRLSEDWKPTVDLWNFASGMGFSASEIEKIVAEFVDYWIDQPGRHGVKVNWRGTFRNRVRAVAERRGMGRLAAETAIDIANTLNLRAE